MHAKGRPVSIAILAGWLTLWFGGLTGCSTMSTTPFPGRGPGQNESKIFFEIQSTTRAVATVYVDGMERGNTPVHIRAEAGVTGGLAEDMVVRAVWDGGSNETQFTIPAGTLPRPIVRIAPTGLREY
jgi:hypothetical protein